MSYTTDQLNEMMVDDLENAKHHLRGLDRHRRSFSPVSDQAHAIVADAFTNHARLCFEMLQAMT